jgi:4-amino-4-deoxy-L-arabinose transferase-like glycosyltransferase
MSSPIAAPAVDRAPRAFVWLGLAALAGYAVFLAMHASLSAGGADTSGYLNSARWLAAGKLRGELRAPPEFGPVAELTLVHFKPLGFDLNVPDEPRLLPTYAVGLPLHLAAAGLVFGWDLAPLVVELAAALGALWLCYAIGRELGLDPWLAASGAVVLGAFPVFLFTSIQPLSDTLATTWCLASIWAGLRARRHRGWAAICGAALSIAIMVRATNAVLLPPLLVLLGLDWRRLAAAALGGLPGALGLAAYNHTLYGGVFRSGYGPIAEAFATRYGAPTAVHFAYWLAVLLPTVLLALPVFVLWRLRTRAVLSLVLWFGTITGVYLFYEVSRDTWWCLRFILPAVPALILLGLLGLQALDPKRRAVAALALALWAIAASVHWTPQLYLLRMKDYEGAYPAACRAARELLPPNALVVSWAVSGALYYYTDFSVLRWDQVDAAAFTRYAQIAALSGRPVCAVLFDGFEDAAQKERVPGQWERVGSTNKITLWRLVAPLPPTVPQ